MAEPPFRYTVQPGDTLSKLARDYLVGGDYRAVQRLNNVSDPFHIPIGTVLLIPEPLLRTVPIVGQITSFRGTVTIDGQPAALGSQVMQGMRIETGANSNVTVGLPEGSAISLPSQSRIRVAKLRRVLLTGGLDRNFVLEAGRSRSTVVPIKDPASNFRVTTPLSVSAVRGTDFRVAIEPDGESALTEVVGGTVGVAPDEEKDETGVGRGFGTIATPAGVQPPIPLLPPPQLQQIERTPDGVAISAKPVDGARSYRFQLATDVAFLNIIDDAVNEKPSAAFTLPSSATFFVRLTATSMAGMEGLPATYAPSGPVGAPVRAPAPPSRPPAEPTPPAKRTVAPDSSADAGAQDDAALAWHRIDDDGRREAARDIQNSVTAHVRSEPPSFGAAKTLR